MKRNRNKIKYFFDKEADVLYFTKRKPSSGDISQEVGEGIVVRSDPKSKEIVGFTILNFLKRQSRKVSSIELPLSAEFEMVK